MASVKFKKGELAQLSTQPKVEGTFYVTTDERALYLDVSGEQRIRLGDFREVANLAALEELKETASETALYYVKDINVLAKWQPQGDPGTPEADSGGKWIQINPDTGAIGVDETEAGSGNVITKITYDDKTRKLKITKGDTFVTETALTAKIGAIEQDTVKAYVDEKTKDIASNTDFQSLQERVQAAEGKLTTLQGEDSVDGSVKHAVKGLKDQLDPEIEKLKTTVGEKAAGPELGSSTGLVKEVDDLKALVGETSVDGQIQTHLLKYALKEHTHTADQITDLSTKLEEKASASDMTQAKSDIEGLQEKIQGLTGAMHFKGTVTEDPTQMDDLEAYAVGDVVVWGQKEYVLTEETSELEAPSKTKRFIELGDTTTEGSRIQALESWKTTATGQITELDGKKHEHTNKTLLDTYTQTEDNLKDAVTKKHSHDNKDELDKITTGKVEQWDAAKQGAIDAAATAATAAIGEAKKELVGQAEDTQDKDTIKGAKKYADDKDTALKEELTQADTQKLQEAKTYADGLVEWGSF